MNQATYMDACSLAELPLGRARAIDANGRRIALFRTAGGVFALDNTCPHRGGPLSEGDVIGGEIVCPWHLWGFERRDRLPVASVGIRARDRPLPWESGGGRGQA